MHDVAMIVGHDLKFNVARIYDQLFQIHLIVAKCFLRLMTRAMESGCKAWLIMRSAHSSAAATGGRFDHHRVAELLSDFHRLVLSLNNSIAARRHRDARFTCRCTSGVFVAHGLHGTGGRANELDVAAFTDLNEMRVFSQEPVAWMDRVNVADLGRAHDPINSQITLKAGGSADADRFISKLDVQRIDVCFGIDCEGANAEFVTGPNHSQRDFSAISNQNFL